MSVCFGCENKQKKDDHVSETNMQKANNISCVTDKSNLKKEEILSWDYDQALAKLGEPDWQTTFPASEISHFSIELLNFLPRDSTIIIKELTFDVNTETNLTIWYVEKDQKWKPVHFMEWVKFSQF